MFNERLLTLPLTEDTCPTCQTCQLILSIPRSNSQFLSMSPYISHNFVSTNLELNQTITPYWCFLSSHLLRPLKVYWYCMTENCSGKDDHSLLPRFPCNWLYLGDCNYMSLLLIHSTVWLNSLISVESARLFFVLFPALQALPIVKCLNTFGISDSPSLGYRRLSSLRIAKFISDV